MNNKGYTLTELLCVIVILGIIATIATTSIVSFASQNKNELYCAKLNLVKTAALDYAKQHEKELNETSSLTINIGDLIASGNLEADTDNTFLDVRDNSNMTSQEITIYLEANQIKVNLNDNICQN